MSDAYQQYLRSQQPNFFDDGTASVIPTFSRPAAIAPAADISATGLSPVLGSNALGYVNTQGAAQPAFASTAAPSVDWGSMAGAGLSAAGAAASGIAQAAAQKQVLDNLVYGNAANRATSERMLKEQLAQNAAQFATSQKMNAYSQLLAALNSGAANAENQRTLKRGIANARADGLTTSYLGK